VCPTRSREIDSYVIPESRSWSTERNALTGALLKEVKPGTLADVVIKGSQTTISENHPDWVTLSKAARMGRKAGLPSGRDWGGEFTMVRNGVAAPLAPFYHTKSKPVFSSSWGVNVIMERFFPLYIPLNTVQRQFPPFAKSSDTQLGAVGSTAIALCSPTNPVASLGVAALETYRDGLPHLAGHQLWEQKTNLAKGAGSEYLNLEFGWNPLVNDVKNFAYGVANMGKLQKQFFQDSGKDVRRRYNFPLKQTVVSSTEITNTSVGGPSNLAAGRDLLSGIPRGVCTRDRKTTVEQWFSGAFTYHAPESFLGPTIDHAIHASELLGLDLNPELLWQAAPWSWAADWFSNTGDLIQNLDNYSKYGLVLRYGYVMEHTIVRDTYSWSRDPTCGFDPTYTPFTGQPPVVVLWSETKIRRRATPFGFGVTLGSLNPTQLAIMGALGLVFLA